MLSIFLRKLMLAGQASFTEGEIKILQKYFYMHPLFDIITFQHDMCKSTNHKMLQILYENGKKTSEELIQHFKKLGITNRSPLLKIWVDLINTFGIAQMEIVSIDEKTAKAWIRAKKSSFAREYISRYGKQKEPVDFILAGAIAGFFSRYFDKSVKCKETSCVAKSELYCQFAVA